MHITNVKLAFPQVATAIWYQLWHDGGSWKGITSFVLAIFCPLLQPTAVSRNFSTKIRSNQTLWLVLRMFRTVNLALSTCLFHVAIDKQQSCLVCLGTAATTATATSPTLTPWINIVLLSLSVTRLCGKDLSVCKGPSGLRTWLLTNCSVNRNLRGLPVCLLRSVC